MVEPLAIKKKSSVRENGSPQARKTYNRHSPLVKSANSPSSPKRVNTQARVSKIPIATHTTAELRHTPDVDVDKLVKLSEATKEDVGYLFLVSLLYADSGLYRSNQLVVLSNGSSLILNNFVRHPLHPPTTSNDPHHL